MNIRSEQDDVRVTSDLSRFDYESGWRNRSRNTTPTSIDDRSSEITFDSILPGIEKKLKGPNSQKFQTGLDTISRGSSQATRNDFHQDVYKHYFSSSDVLTTQLSTKNFNAYPVSVKEQPTGNVVDLPYNNDHPLHLPGFGSQSTIGFPNSIGELNGEDINEKISSHLFEDNGPIVPPKDVSKDLPPMPSPQETYPKSQREPSIRSNLTLATRRRHLEQNMIRGVMNNPIYTFRANNIIGANYYEDKEWNITTHFIFYVIEIMFEIIVISISGVLLNSDKDVSPRIYQYFIATGSVSLLVSLLFITKLINFERRNGSFYCLASTLMMIASFIIVVAVIMPRKCPSSTTCAMRKTAGSFIIISTFLWVANLVMFLTTLFISRMNLLDDINFDYSHEGAVKEFQLPSDHYPPSYDQRYYPDPPLKEYALNEVGELTEVNDLMQLQNRNKVIVYTY